MANAFMVSGLTKTYQDFVLDHVSFTVPSGSIVGLIGENGAGKSTTINAALGLIQKEDGVVSILDREELDRDIKEQIGVVFDGSNYPEILSPRKLNRVMKNIYRTWDEQVYLRLLKQFSLPSDKQIRQFSKGMKMKLAISVAFSHYSRLLILDEATSGLDPVARDERCFGERYLYCQEQYPCNHCQSGYFGLWLILFAGNQRTSGFSSGFLNNISLYQYYQ